MAASTSATSSFNAALTSTNSSLNEDYTYLEATSALEAGGFVCIHQKPPGVNTRPLARLFHKCITGENSSPQSQTVEPKQASLKVYCLDEHNVTLKVWQEIFNKNGYPNCACALTDTMKEKVEKILKDAYISASERDPTFSYASLSLKLGNCVWMHQESSDGGTRTFDIFHNCLKAENSSQQFQTVEPKNISLSVICLDGHKDTLQTWTVFLGSRGFQVCSCDLRSRIVKQQDEIFNEDQKIFKSVSRYCHEEFQKPRLHVGDLY